MSFCVFLCVNKGHKLVLVHDATMLWIETSTKVKTWKTFFIIETHCVYPTWGVRGDSSDADFIFIRHALAVAIASLRVLHGDAQKRSSRNLNNDNIKKTGRKPPRKPLPQAIPKGLHGPKAVVADSFLVQDHGWLPCHATTQSKGNKKQKQRTAETLEFDGQTKP